MNKPDNSRDFDSYDIEEPSDEERAVSSSEDELDVLLNGTPQQKKKLIREYLTGESESSSEDEFEKEMEAELSTTIRTLEGSWGPVAAVQSSENGGDSGSVAPGQSAHQLYDKVYFDSDDEEETQDVATRQRQRQRVILTNDELFYDPEEDDRDQAWVDAKRRQYRRKRPVGAVQSQSNRPQGIPSSDAVLNCPACMTTLCLDCQRHEKYRTQYRAMFVINCTVKKDQVLRYQAQQDRKQKNRKRRRDQIQNQQPTNQDPSPAPAGMDSEETYHPVQCSECSTEVAVFDKEEVYHFFNILASHS